MKYVHIFILLMLSFQANAWLSPPSGKDSVKQEQEQKQHQNQSQSSTNNNRSVSNAVGRGGEGGAGGNSESYSKAYGGESNSKSKSYSEGGDSRSMAKGGNSKSESDSYSEGSSADSNSASNISIDASENREDAASSAASLYSAGCQTGASSQTQKGGISMIVDDASCQALRVADAHAEALMRCAKLDKECKEFHHAKVHEFLEVAGVNVSKTEPYNRFAKSGMNVGMGSLGIATLVYMLILL